jgi:hypothetical protein
MASPGVLHWPVFISLSVSGQLAHARIAFGDDLTFLGVDLLDVLGTDQCWHFPP